MHTSSIALNQLQSLLGISATDDTLWRELRQFETAALPLIGQLWDLDAVQNGAYWRIIHPSEEAARQRHKQRIAQAIKQIRAALGAATAERGAAAIYLHPQLWQAAYTRSRSYYSSRGHAEMQLLDQIAHASVTAHPPADWAQRLARRIVALCNAHNIGDGPDLALCVGFLVGCSPTIAGPTLDALTAGDWRGAWRAVLALSGHNQPPAVERLRDLWLERGSQHTIVLLRRLFDRGRLDSAVFGHFLTTLPHSLTMINAHLAYSVAHPPSSQSDQAFLALLERLTNAVLWTLVSDFRPEMWPTLGNIRYLTGGRYLLRLAEEVERHGLAPLRATGYGHDRVANVLVELFSNLHRRSDDDPAALTGLLRQLSVPTLLAVLPHASEYQPELCAALDWPNIAPLLALLTRLETPDPSRSADPSVGVVRREEVLNVLGAVDDFHLQSLLATFEHHTPAAVTLVRAVLGLNRKELRRLFGRRNQLAARALPLLPLEQPNDVLERYLLLMRFIQDANSSAAGRKNYERAAARAGLSNLALHAGYADATRLEWAMADQLGSETIALGRSWEIEGYTLTLTLRDHKPALDVRNGERSLKRAPVAVTRDYAYREVRTTLETAQDQLRRYRTAFLEAMRSDQPLSGEELALLRRNPLAVSLLERLVLLDESGACGLFRAADSTLEGTHGERVPISGAVRIAHPYTLLQHEWLADWQAEIVRREIVQPFKQVFREVYVITPAELEAAFASARLAGRQLKGRQAAAVLANLGWLVDGASVRKPLYALGYAAHFETGSYGGYANDDDDASATTGRLEFWPLKYAHTKGERRIDLATIPPLVFSEIMRDLDMVTVIAHQSEEYGTSKEVLQQRADLVRATVAALGLRQVEVEVPHVLVHGSLTSYRIHLATGAIYLANGQYLCIVPSPKKRSAIYLPFEEGGEPISSEIISKVLLLANDARISDASIVAQIAPSIQP